MTGSRSASDGVVVVIADADDPGVIAGGDQGGGRSTGGGVAEPMAPMAPEPLVPVRSTPLKLVTVIEEATLWERVADGRKATSTQ